MKTIFQFFILFGILGFQSALSAQTALELNHFFKDADAFFASYAQNGHIKYNKLKENSADLDALVRFIANSPLKNIDTYKRKAYFINCYNLLVIKGVIDKYPITSVNESDGFFKKTQHNVGGTMMTLDHLEYKIIFKEFTDPRLHFVLVCAAKGCPPIPSFAYTPDNLSEQMNTQCQLAMDNPSFLYLEDDGNLVKLSPIFQWYKEDFEPSIVDFVNSHRSEKLSKEVELAYYEYDWRLNLWEGN